MALGVYIHIPYCLQRCTYCDFATYEHTKIMPTADYVELLQSEIKARSKTLVPSQLQSLYFGGGTPSLLRPEQIISLIQGLENEGFVMGPACEITMEINPATVTRSQLKILIDSGVNRFSVGAQTFDDPLLKSVHREHSAQQTRETLSLLASQGINFSADLLFALPGQTLQILDQDLDELLSFQPRHISPYCLTVPEGHVLAKGRPLDDVQLEMFSLIHRRLLDHGYERYEISNYCLPGFRSRHNSLYWDGDEYIGFGLSAHSYLKTGAWGRRFWNPSAIGAYAELVREQMQSPWPTPYEGLPDQLQEDLKAHEALTDFCHISLRRQEGFSMKDLQSRFGARGRQLVEGPLGQLLEEGLLQEAEGRFSLSEEGVLVSNQVFRNLTFLAQEWEQTEP